MLDIMNGRVRVKYKKYYKWKILYSYKKQLCLQTIHLYIL